MSRHQSGREMGAAMKGPALWSCREVEFAQPEPRPGQYPKGFIAFAARAMRVQRSDILHICSGSLPRGEGWLRIDINPNAAPDVLADGRALPLADGCAPAVLID